MIPEALQLNLRQCLARYEEINALLSSPEVVADGVLFAKLSKEHAALEPLVACYQEVADLQAELADLASLLSDPELEAMANEESQRLGEQLEASEAALLLQLLPSDPNDSHNVYLEIRAGTGGDEAAIFAGDLFRMYQRYAETQGWRLALMSQAPGEHGGFKAIVAHVTGRDVYAQLKFESGAHRVQRVPATESQGRIHTSACTVAVLPEMESIEDFEIKTADLRVDTFRSSGAGGQHVNTTDSAVRLTHLPTGVVVECQDERSQHKNKAKAMQMLKSKLLAKAQDDQMRQQASERKSLVGSGDRSERIRTYNYPQGRVTDHRIGLTLYRLDDVLDGQLRAVIEPLLQAHQAELLADLNHRG